MARVELAGYIDHTLLKPKAGTDAVQTLCQEAREYGFACVCILPTYVSQAVSSLEDSGVVVATVVGFPLGSTFTSTKVQETREAVELGAREIDMVMNIAWAVDGQWDLVEEDIARVVEAAAGNPVKVIIETCDLNEEQKIEAAERVVAAKGAYVKTSTGMGTGGATLQDVQLLEKVLKGRARIKASGGIRTQEKALAMIEAGAHRLGTSSGVFLVGGE